MQDNEIIRTVEQWMDWAIGWMTSPIFTVGEAAFSVSSVAKFLVFLALVFWLSRLTRRLLEQRALPRLGLETGISHALANIAASGTALLITEQNSHRLPGFCTTTLAIDDGVVAIQA